MTAEVGDARRLTQVDASVDAVLLLGPLYHLLGRAERIERFMAVLDWAQCGGLTADVAAKLVPVLSTGVHDSTLGFTDAFFRRSAAAGGGGGRIRRRTRPGDRGAGVDIVNAPGDDADARFDSALRCAQLTENFAEIVDASAHLMALATALLASARGETVAELGEGSLRF